MLDVGAKAAPYDSTFAPSVMFGSTSIPRKSRTSAATSTNSKWDGDPFDTVLAIEVLEHLYDPQRAINRIHGALKPGGVCILSTRFMYRYHPDPQDHYRFTWDSLKYLFRNYRTSKSFTTATARR